MSSTYMQCAIYTQAYPRKTSMRRENILCTIVTN